MAKPPSASQNMSKHLFESIITTMSVGAQRHSFARWLQLRQALQLEAKSLRPVSDHFSTLRLFFTENTPETPLLEYWQCPCLSHRPRPLRASHCHSLR